MRITPSILAVLLAATSQLSPAATATPVWSADAFGGGAPVAVAIDAAGDAIVAGNVDGAFRLIKFSGSSGSPMWEKRAAGGALDIAWGLALDSAGDAFLMGKAAGASTEVWVAKHRGTNGPWRGSPAAAAPSSGARSTTRAGLM